MTEEQEEIKSDRAKKLQVRSDVETEKEFAQLFKLSGYKTKGELMKKLIQLGFMEQIKERQLQEIELDSQSDTVGTSILKLQHLLDGIAKVFVDQQETMTESLISVHEKKQEETEGLKIEIDTLKRRNQAVEKELGTLNGKLTALEDAATTNAEVLASYENYKRLTQPKVEELEQKLHFFEKQKKEELADSQQTIQRLEEELRLEKNKGSDHELANKQLVINYETKLLEERGRSSEAQDKIRREMQVEIDAVREQLWKSRTEKSPGRTPKQAKDSIDKA